MFAAIAIIVALVIIVVVLVVEGFRHTDYLRRETARDERDIAAGAAVRCCLNGFACRQTACRRFGDCTHFLSGFDPRCHPGVW